MLRCFNVIVFILISDLKCGKDFSLKTLQVLNKNGSFSELEDPTTIQLEYPFFNLVFLVLYILLLTIQFICMLLHRYAYIVSLVAFPMSQRQPFIGYLLCPQVFDTDSLHGLHRDIKEMARNEENTKKYQNIADISLKIIIFHFLVIFSKPPFNFKWVGKY